MTNDPTPPEQQDTFLREEPSRAQAELHPLDQPQRDVTMLAAHELCHPLAILLGYAKILEDESSGNAREHAGIVVARAQQLKGIVDSLLVLQQIDAGEFTLHQSTFSVAEGIQDVINSEQENVRFKALHVELYIEPGLYVCADRERFALAFANLLSHAIKSSPHNGHITIHTRADSTTIVASIHDNGIGIPASEQAHIFERFDPINSPHAHTKNGRELRLAAAKALIELHRGRIWVESVPKQGSTFSFALPRTYPINTSTILRQAIPAVL